MQLSKRMDRLASMVTEGSSLADVGTDHGYIPIALIQTGARCVTYQGTASGRQDYHTTF